MISSNSKDLIQSFLIVTAIFAAVFLLSSCQGEIPIETTRPGAERLRLIAESYAPLVLQETDPVCHKCDFITRFNYDGNYRGKDNWENLDAIETVPAYVYYSVTETASHLFIGYYFYHPRDWGVERGPIDLALSNHENDLEGIMLLVDKTLAGLPGDVVAVETQGHNQLFQFSRCRYLDEETETNIVHGGRENLDGCILTIQADREPFCMYGECLPGLLRQTSMSLEGEHPLILIESNGHGVSGCTSAGVSIPLNVSCVEPSTGHGVVYRYGSTAEAPPEIPGAYSRTVSYQLIAMEEGTLSPGDPNEDQGFWYLRNHIGDDLSFSSWGRLRGDQQNGSAMPCGGGLASCSQNAASAPWVWDDPDDGPVFGGDWYCDPAYTLSSHLDGPFEERYSFSYNQPYYFTHAITIESVRVERSRCDSGSNDCDVYVRVRSGGAAGTEPVIDKGNWLVNNFPAGEWMFWNHGAGIPISPAENFLIPRNRRHICRPGGAAASFTFEIFDSDAANPDDRIGIPGVISGPSPLVGLITLNLEEAQLLYRIEVSDTSPGRPAWVQKYTELLRRLKLID